MQPNERETQFYGFVDDLAVFNRALTGSEVQALNAENSLTGLEAGLIAGYTFDDGRLPAVLRQPYAINGNAFIAHVSSERNNAVDTAALPRPAQSQAFRLPFDSADTWEVIQAFNSLGSHRGYAAFCWDFNFVQLGAATGHPQLNAAFSFNRNVRSAANGIVDEVSINDGTSAVIVAHQPSELSNYLHVRMDPPQVFAGQLVQLGQLIANSADLGAGAGNYHLHFAATDHPERQHGQLVTFPVEFAGYSVSDDYGLSWPGLIRGCHASVSGFEYHPDRTVHSGRRP